MCAIIDSMDIRNIYTNKQLAQYMEFGLLDIGDFSYGCPYILYYERGAKLKIGKFCSFAENITVLLGVDHRVDWVTTYPFSSKEANNEWPGGLGITGHPLNKGNMEIGNDVWVGYGAIICSGVNIGDGAVVGAGSVVTKDVEPYSIVVGNPARELKKRFSDEVIAELLRIKWWDWDKEKIDKHIKILCSGDIEKLLTIK
jgi:acetyltransferase-like isoleucine patch superfamily enzyme